jgi:hypothetical protein
MSMLIVPLKGVVTAGLLAKVWRSGRAWPQFGRRRIIPSG